MAENFANIVVSWSILLKQLKITASICLFLLIAHGSLFYLSQEIIILQSKIAARFCLYNDQAHENLILVKVIPKGTHLGDNEITFHGKLYDVVRSVEKQDSIYCYGLEDESENDANLRLSNAFQQPNHSSGINDFTNSTHHHLVLAVDQYYIPHISSACTMLSLASRSFESLMISYCSASLDFPTPPPEKSPI